MSNLDRLVSENFTNHCKSYDKYALVQDLAASYLIDMVSADIDLSNVKCILDVGAGTGKLFSAIFNQKENILSRDTKLFATDISQGMLKVLKQKFPQVITMQDDFNNYSEKIFTYKFDLIISSFALQWSIDPAKVITNYVKLLKDGGKIYFAIPIEGSLDELKQVFNRLGYSSFINNQIVATDLIKDLILKLQSSNIYINKLTNNFQSESIDKVLVNNLLNNSLNNDILVKNEFEYSSVDVLLNDKDFTVNYDNIFDVFHSITRIGAGTRLEENKISLNRQILSKLNEFYPTINFKAKILFPVSYKIFLIKITKNLKE